MKPVQLRGWVRLACPTCLRRIAAPVASVRARDIRPWVSPRPKDTLPCPYCTSDGRGAGPSLEVEPAPGDVRRCYWADTAGPLHGHKKRAQCTTMPVRIGCRVCRRLYGTRVWKTFLDEQAEGSTHA